MEHLTVTLNTRRGKKSGLARRVTLKRPDSIYESQPGSLWSTHSLRLTRGFVFVYLELGQIAIRVLRDFYGTKEYQELKRKHDMASKSTDTDLSKSQSVVDLSPGASGEPLVSIPSLRVQGPVSYSPNSPSYSPSSPSYHPTSTTHSACLCTLCQSSSSTTWYSPSYSPTSPSYQPPYPYNHPVQVPPTILQSGSVDLSESSDKCRTCKSGPVVSSDPNRECQFCHSFRAIHLETQIDCQICHVSHVGNSMNTTSV